jgi:branched-chain amino acid transport system permease protein
VDAYAASVIGRLRSIPMTFLGAIILGLAVSYSVAYLPSNPYVQGFEGAVPAVVLFVSLLLLPQSRLRGHGLLRSRELALVPTWRGTGIFGAAVVLFTIMVATVVSQSDLYSLDRVWGLAIVGLSLVPVVGYAGRLSLCQMTFAGIGAVVVGHMGGNPLSILAAAGICSIAGVLVALPALRLSGIYFALSTAAFATAMDAWVFPLPAFDLFGHQFAPFGSGSLNFVPFHIGGWALTSKEGQFIAGAVAFVLLAALVVLVRRSEFGSRLFAFKDSPVACATLGMNTRLLPIAVFAISAAIAGVGGALYGEALGSAAPDIYQFLTGLTVLLTMVVAGIGAVGAGVGTGYFLGGPTLANFFPSLTQLQTVLVGGSAVGVGTSPNGLIPSGLRPVWSSVVRRRVLFAAVILVVLLLWVLRLAGVIANWPFVWALFAIVVGCSIVPYALDRRRGEAPAAFGMPALALSRPVGSSPGDAPRADQDLTAMPEQVATIARTGSHGA